MSITVINAKLFYEMMANGYRNLCRMENQVNDLNVFPVPDGDTGTNMARTLGGGFGTVPAEDEETSTFMKKFSKSVLLSARGNSGVILSQFIRGLSIACADKKEITLGDIHEILKQGTETAYSAVGNPVEGTMLTIIRSTSEAVENKEFASFEECFDAIVANAKVTLQKTPEMLPVLKEAGVVDSGGMGMIYIFEGMSAYIKGDIIETDSERADIVSPVAMGSFGPDSVLEYGYCTEFVLQLMNYKTDLSRFDLQQFTKPLEQMGDSIVAVHNDGIVKIHIHTFTPETVLSYGRRFGEFVSLKIENMSIQHSQAQPEAKKEKVKYAIIAVASGEGIQEYFKSIGTSYVIDGGQTNNPPVSAFLDAFDQFDAEHIVVLPNNSNIILTANQAADAYTTCDVRVIPTKSIVEGYSALSMMNLWCDTVEELIEDMSANLGSVTTGYVTTSIRDTHMDGLDVKKGSYIGLDGKHILTTGENRVETAKDLVRRITAVTPKDVIIFFCGAGVSQEETDDLALFLQTEYPMVDTGFVEGKQAVYDFIISLE